MLQPHRLITFTKKNGTIIEYNYCAELHIVRDRESLTDTARIVIPRKLIYNSGQGLNMQNQTTQPVSGVVPVPTQNATVNVEYVIGDAPMFEVGDQVTIQCGYYPNLATRFVGYISKVSTKLPLEIYCEDKMWLLKQFNVTFPDSKTWTKPTKTKASVEQQGFINVTLKQLLDNIFQYYPEKINYVTIDDTVNLGKWRISNQSPAFILETLKDKYGLFSKFRDDGTLYVGWLQDATLTNEQDFPFEQVVINNDTLEYQNENTVKVRIHGVSMMADNTKLEYDFPEYAPVSGSHATNGYDTITKFTYNQDLAGLKEYVKRIYPTVNYTGYKGKLRTFGEPPMKIGDVANITSTKMPERNGKYLIKGVEVEDGVNGYFQVLDLGTKIS